MEKRRKVKRKINFQKIFCFSSFIFILVCFLWYGSRFIYLYQESEKVINEESNTLARIIKTNNHDKDTFKKIGEDYYFYGDVDNNYVSYSNLLWRIIKVNKDNSIVLTTDNIVTTLAYGDGNNNYDESVLFNWLNSNTKNTNSGVFENILNDKEKYLIKNSTCIDNISDVSNITCNNTYNDNYLGLLSINDYIYTGSNNSFINNNRYSYLANKNNYDEVWYINSNGKLDTSNGEDILGLKVTITLKANIEIKNGTGTSDDYYYFEDTPSYIGSYVKLGNDMWRIYQEDAGIVKLVSQDLIKDNNDNFKYKYSKKNYYHNDTIKNSLAYYLNNTYYNNLSYKNLIVENKYVNGYYGSDTDYKLDNINSSNIDTKVSIPSIGDIIFNDSLIGYFTNTGLSKNSSLIYIQEDMGIVTTDNVSSEAFVIPCISINKEKLTLGSGSLNDPYRTE